MTEREQLPKEEERSTGARVYDAPRSVPDPDKRRMMIIIVVSILVALLGFGLIILLTLL